MIIVLKPNASESDANEILDKIASLGLKPLYIPGVERTVLGALGDERVLRQLHLDSYPMVDQIKPVLSPYKLVSRELQAHDSTVSIGGVKVGGGNFTVIAGPCSVESQEQLFDIAEMIKSHQVPLLRGGAYKPRTSPYSFQGLGEEGLKLLKAAKAEYQLPVVSENNELSNKFIFTKYQELNKSSEMIGRVSLYLQSINTFDGSDVRISKRAVIPYSRLRGFKKGKVGPVDKTDYIGGNYVSALNLSTNLPGVLSTLENLDFNYFVDIANVWGVDYDSSLDKSKIRSSTGVGLNVLTPIGPLSFSLTQPITKASSDKTETFRFNLGTTF